MIDKQDKEELEHTLFLFKNEKIGATNTHVNLNNGVTIVLAHWVQSEDELTIKITIPRRSPTLDSNKLSQALEATLKRLLRPLINY